jgi:hypothetical protein
MFVRTLHVETKSVAHNPSKMDAPYSQKREEKAINPCKQQISGFEAHKYGVRSCSKKLRLTFYKTYVVGHDP